MKAAVLVLMLGLCASAVGGSRHVDAGSTNDLKGPVRSIREEVAEYRFVNGRFVELERRLQSEQIYAADGSLTSSVHYVDGRVTEIHRYERVSADTVVETVRYRRGEMRFALASSRPQQVGQKASWRNERVTITTTNNANGAIDRVVRRSEGPGGVSEFSERYRSDDSGRISEVIRENPQGAQIGREVREYDQLGVLSLSESFDATGNRLSATAYDGYGVDSQGNWNRRVEHETTQTGVSTHRVVYRTIHYQVPETPKRDRSNVARRMPFRSCPFSGCAFALAARSVSGSTTASADEVRAESAMAKNDLRGVLDRLQARSNETKPGQFHRRTETVILTEVRKSEPVEDGKGDKDEPSRFQ